MNTRISENPRLEGGGEGFPGFLPELFRVVSFSRNLMKIKNMSIFYRTLSFFLRSRRMTCLSNSLVPMLTCGGRVALQVELAAAIVQRQATFPHTHAIVCICVLGQICPTHSLRTTRGPARAPQKNSCLFVHNYDPQSRF